MSDRPALLGGGPTFPDGPPPWPPADDAVRDALAGAFASGDWGRYRGSRVPALCEALVEFFQAEHAFPVASGTLAVEAALRALRVGPGDEVILAGYDYEPNFLSAHQAGATPVLVDVDPHGANLAEFAHAVSDKTKAVMATHLHGGLVPMRKIRDDADRLGVAVIEDAAQAPGAVIDGRPAGSWGDFGVLSFGGSKLLSAGRGGALLARDARRAQQARLVLRRGVQEWAVLSELQAAALLPQLAALPGRTRARRDAVLRLVEGLQYVPGIEPFRNANPDDTPAYYKVGFRFDAAAFGLPRDVFCRAMRAEGVAMDPGFRALHVGRSRSRYRAAGELKHAGRVHDDCVILHHPVLLAGPGATESVIAALTKIRRHKMELGNL